MPNTSGTYDFQSIEIELIIREAFERIGIAGELIEFQKLDSAKRSIDFLLLEWMNKSVNLWTLQGEYLPLLPGRSQYLLPNTVSSIIQANLRTSVRQLNGVAQTNTGASYDNGGGGNPNNAFDNNSSTACTQNVTDGNISYDYGVGITQQINFIGIQSDVERIYTLVVEYSQDTIIWNNLFTLAPQTFQVGVNVWFDLLQPIGARAYRIRETGGAILSLQEIYFNNTVQDMALGEISRDDYLSYSNKKTAGRPNIFYFDRQLSPLLNLYPVPLEQYNCLFYSYKKMIQYTGELYTNTVQIPSRFYPCLVWGLSWQLALKYRPQLTEMMQVEYEKSFSLAAIEDSEITPINIYGNFQEYDY